MNNQVVVISREESLIDLERRVEVGLSGGMDAISAMREIRDRELWKEKFASFEDYCFGRFGIEPSHTKRLINLKLPDRLEQREIWHENKPAISPTAIADISVRIAQAKRQGGETLVDLVKQEEADIKAEEEEINKRFKQNVDRENINQLLAKLKWCAGIARKMERVSWLELIRKLVDEVKNYQVD